MHVTSLSLADADLKNLVDALRAARRFHPPGAENVFAKAFMDTKRGWPRRLYDERAEEIRYEPFESGVMVRLDSRNACGGPPRRGRIATAASRNEGGLAVAKSARDSD